MRSQRLIAAAVVIALSGALAGCSTGVSNWDPTDLLDFLDTKKKLPGERKPVFPGGVPGLEQGVPKDLYKGAAQQQDAPAVAAVQPEEPKPQKSAKKAKGKQPANTPAAAAAPDGEAAPEEEGSTAAAPPAPKAKIVRRRTTAPPPDAPAPQAAQPAQPQQAATPFPAPMPSGTFQR
jgi:pyruvate/2-oxoglutarate dehydrogenase complex dihydrolipoamide acyltransferase (E2) component